MEVGLDTKTTVAELTRELGTLLTNLSFRDNMHTDVITIDMPVGIDSTTISNRLKSKVQFFLPVNKRARGDVYVSNDTERNITIVKINTEEPVKLQMLVFGG